MHSHVTEQINADKNPHDAAGLQGASTVQIMECTEADRKAAWDIYIEIITRPVLDDVSNYDTMSPVIPHHIITGVMDVITVTRDILKQYGYESQNTSDIAIKMISRVLSPIYKEYGKSDDNYLAGQFVFDRLKGDLEDMQSKLKEYVGQFHEIACGQRPAVRG